MSDMNDKAKAIIAGDRGLTHWYECGNCGTDLNPFETVCPNCGKAIDWEEDETE